MDDSSELIRIGAAAKRAGMSVKTVRFYSDEGLIPIAERTQGGYRLYHQQVVEELHLIDEVELLNHLLVIKPVSPLGSFSDGNKPLVAVEANRLNAHSSPLSGSANADQFAGVIHGLTLHLLEA